MGETRTLNAEDGHELAAYRAVPAGKPRGALVIVQEIFGVNSHMKRVCDGFATDGYVALAPALFDRVVNDMSEVDVDAQLMKNGSTSLSRVDERFVEMPNG